MFQTQRFRTYAHVSRTTQPPPSQAEQEKKYASIPPLSHVLLPLTRFKKNRGVPINGGEEGSRHDNDDDDEINYLLGSLSWDRNPGGGPTMLATCFLTGFFTLPCSDGRGTPWIARGSFIRAGSSRSGTRVTMLL